MKECHVIGIMGNLCRERGDCALKDYFFRHEPATREAKRHCVQAGIERANMQLNSVSNYTGCLCLDEIAQELRGVIADFTKTE